MGGGNSGGALLEMDVYDPIANAWVDENKGIGEYFDTFGDKLPGEMRNQHAALDQRLEQVRVRG